MNNRVKETKVKVAVEIITGLLASPKYISSKYFYDEKGCELFEEITKLDEYYPTRIEKKIISTIGQDLNIDFTDLSIVELGSGNCSKIRLLLQQIPRHKLSTIKYYPVDISEYAIEKSLEQLTDEFPEIQIEGIVANFLHPVEILPKASNRLICFFGSTIGNLDINERKRFMQQLGNEMQPNDSLILGVDMIKDVAVLERAYNDAKEVTAKFNLNILNVVNDLADTDFETSAFKHLAFYNEEEQRIEMHLEALRDLEILYNSGKNKIHISKGETIHTENSHKFNRNHILTMGLWAGLAVEKIIVDEEQMFSIVHYLKKK